MTVQGDRAAAALLSIPYNEGKDHASSPCVVWMIRTDGSLVLDIDISWAGKGYRAQDEEEEIIAHGPLKTREELYDAIADLGSNGFKVLITDIKPAAFRVEGDTVIFSASPETEASKKPNPLVKRPRKDISQQTLIKEELKYPIRDDLRVYLSHLYLDGSKINIHLLGKKVKMIDPYSLLVNHKKTYSKYLLEQGTKEEGAWKMSLGFWAKGTEAKKDFGLMMYKDGRLVEYYKKYGIMSGRGGSGNWIQGVVEVPKAIDHVLTKDRFSRPSDELDRVESQIKKIVSMWYSEVNKDEKLKKQGSTITEVQKQMKKVDKGSEVKGRGSAAAEKEKDEVGKKRKALADDILDEDYEEEEEGTDKINPPSKRSIPPPAAPALVATGSKLNKASNLSTVHAARNNDKQVPNLASRITITLPPPSTSLISRGLAKEVGTQTYSSAAVDNGSSKIVGLEQQVQLLLKASSDQMQRGNVLEREKIQLEMELDVLKSKIKENHLQCFFGVTPAKGQK